MCFFFLCIPRKIAYNELCQTKLTLLLLVPGDLAILLHYNLLGLRVGSRTTMAETISMKLAIVGKGGVGKTTLAAALARDWAAQGRAVIAVDADPDGNLAAALGVPADAVPQPIAAMRDLILERTGAKDQGAG